MLMMQNCLLWLLSATQKSDKTTFDMQEISLPNNSEGWVVVKLLQHIDHWERLDHDNIQLTWLYR